MPNIDSYEFGKIVVDGKEHTNDIIIFPDYIKEKWWRKEGHLLQAEDLEEIWNLGNNNINSLIVGQGADRIMKIDQGVREKCKKLNIVLIAKKSDEACNFYNNLDDNDKNETVFTIHLTC